MRVGPSRPWRSSIARTASVSSSVGLDQRQAQAADVVAEQVQRGLRAGRAGGHEQRLVDVAQRRVDLRALLGLVDHAAHLVADDVAGDEDPAGAAHVERARERRVVAGVDGEAVDQLQLVGVGLLDALDALDLRELGEQVGRHVRAGARGDVVEQDRLVGRGGDRFVVAPEPERGWGGCSTGVTDSIASTPSSVARSVRCTAWRVSLVPVPAMIVLPGGRSATASSISPSCSSSVSVEASPVVPATTKPSEPFSARWLHQRDERLLVDPQIARRTA